MKNDKNSLEKSLENILNNVPKVVKETMDVYKNSREKVLSKIFETCINDHERQDKYFLTDKVSIINSLDYFTAWANIDEKEATDILKSLIWRTRGDIETSLDENTMRIHFPLSIMLGKLPSMHLFNKSAWGEDDLLPRVEIRKSVDLNILHGSGNEAARISYRNSLGINDSIITNACGTYGELVSANDYVEPDESYKSYYYGDENPKMIIDLRTLIIQFYTMELDALKKTFTGFLKINHKHFYTSINKNIIDEINYSSIFSYLNRRLNWGYKDDNLLLEKSQNFELIFSDLYASELLKYVESQLEDDKDVKDAFLKEYEKNLDIIRENIEYRITFSCLKTACIFYGFNDEYKEYNLLNELSTNLLKLNDSDVRSSFSLFGGSLRSDSRDFDQRDKPLNKMEYLELNTRQTIDDAISLLKILTGKLDDPNKNANKEYHVNNTYWVNILRNDDNNEYGGMANLNKEISRYNMTDTLFAYFYSLLNLTSIYDDIIGNYTNVISRKHSTTDNVWINANNFIEKVLSTVHNQEIKDRITATFDYFKRINICKRRNNFLIEDDRERLIYTNYKHLSRLIKLLLIYSLRQIELMRDEDKIFKSQNVEKITMLKNLFIDNSQSIVKIIGKLRAFFIHETSYYSIGTSSMDAGIVDNNTSHIMRNVFDRHWDMYSKIAGDKERITEFELYKKYNNYASFETIDNPTKIIDRLCSMAHTLTIFEDNYNDKRYNYTLFDKDRLRQVFSEKKKYRYEYGHYQLSKSKEPLAQFYKRNMTIDDLDKVEWGTIFNREDSEFDSAFTENVLVVESLIYEFRKSFSNSVENSERILNIEKKYSNVMYDYLKKFNIVRGVSDVI